MSEFVTTGESRIVTAHGIFNTIITKAEVVAIGDTRPFGKVSLIGIIHSYIPYRETLINSQTGETVEIRSENSGIAKANPVEYIKEVVDMELRRNYTEDELAH